MTELKARGHTFRDVGREYGNMQAILIDKKSGEVTAASDPRGIGSAIDDENLYSLVAALSMMIKKPCGLGLVAALL